MNSLQRFAIPGWPQRFSRKAAFSPTILAEISSGGVARADFGRPRVAIPSCVCSLGEIRYMGLDHFSCLYFSKPALSRFVGCIRVVPWPKLDVERCQSPKASFGRKNFHRRLLKRSRTDVPFSSSYSASDARAFPAPTQSNLMLSRPAHIGVINVGFLGASFHVQCFRNPGPSVQSQYKFLWRTIDGWASTSTQKNTCRNVQLHFLLVVPCGARRVSLQGRIGI